MDRHPNDLTTDEEIDAAFLRAAEFEKTFPFIVEAKYVHAPYPLLMLRLKNGQQLLIPKEMLSELNDATPEQAADLQVLGGVDIWWPQLDDGMSFPTFLKHRWKDAALALAA